MRVFKFRIPYPVTMLNEWQRMHWAVRKKYQTQLSWDVIEAAGLRGKEWAEPFKRCHIEVVRGSAVSPDPDNLYSCCKPLLDVLKMPAGKTSAGIGIIEDDNSECILNLTVQYAKAPRKQGYTEVKITEVE